MGKFDFNKKNFNYKLSIIYGNSLHLQIARPNRRNKRIIYLSFYYIFAKNVLWLIMFLFFVKKNVRKLENINANKKSQIDLEGNFLETVQKFPEKNRVY